MVRAIALGLLAALAGCATPLARLDERAASSGFERLLLDGRGFTHLAYAHDVAGNRSLHVYLEGDGIAWLTRRIPSSDPSPRQALMFDAMRLDAGAALYLGRPCHYVGLDHPGCTTLAWTHQRYSEAVVASLAAALRSYLERRPTDSLVFFGHSGGGTLATLLAARFARASAVITIAANLDVDGWTSHHGYSRLEGSLDPTALAPLRPELRQWHLMGSADREIPPQLAQRYLAANPQAWFSIIDDFDHTCCWLSLWPGVLRIVAALPNRPLPFVN